jgi:outer membrane protein assembly factor BamB
MPWSRTLLALVILGCGTAVAGDWPQWLGPNRDGASPEKVAAWKKPLKVLWHKPAGEGNSSPVVAGGRVFIHAKIKDKNEEEVVAFDAKTGQELWRTSYPRVEFKSLFGNGPRATPAVAGDKVYTFGITGVLTCFKAKDGEKVWQVDTLKTFKAPNLRFGLSCSPLVEGQRVLVNVGGKGTSVVAFDKDEGTVAWKSRSDGASYSSPIVFGKGKERQVVFLTADGVISLDPANGNLFWRFPLRDLLFESSTTPVRAGDYLLASSITYGCVGLRLKTQQDKPAAEKEWKNGLTCYFSTPVPVGSDYVYLVTGNNPLAFGRRSEAILRCIETKTGKELWKRPNVGKYHASLLRTGDNKLLMLEEKGDLVLLDPSPKEYQELARSKVCGTTWAHPAMANGRLYVRDNKEVICIEFGK